MSEGGPLFECYVNDQSSVVKEGRHRDSSDVYELDEVRVDIDDPFSRHSIKSTDYGISCSNKPW